MPNISNPIPPTSPAPASPLHGDADARLPAAAYLRYESRADGWSAGRQAAFCAHLADHGVVEDAARSVGMSLSGGYALRRQARGYAFHLAWEAALLIARRIVADKLMTAAIQGEQAVWLREEGKTTYSRQNTKLSLTLLDRVNPADALPEVMAVATRFDVFLEMIDDGLSAAEYWEYFFSEALPHTDMEARQRVRTSLLLCEESADFEEEDEEEEEAEAAIEYKSMDGPVPLPPGSRPENNLNPAVLRLTDAVFGFAKGLGRHHIVGDASQSEIGANSIYSPLGKAHTVPRAVGKFCGSPGNHDLDFAAALKSLDGFVE